MSNIGIRLIDTLAAPVSLRGGVPFAAGALGPGEPVRLVTPDGADVPFDAEPIAFWPDGSVRWLRLDFVAPESTGRLVLRTGEAAPASPGLKIEEDAEAFRVDTGELSFKVGKRSFALLRNCRLAGVQALAPKGIDLITRDYFRMPYAASRDESYSCELEELGANHAVFRLSGAHVGRRGRCLDYEVRLHCWAGSAAVRIVHTLRSRQDDELPLARAVEISMPMPESPSGLIAGVPGRDGRIEIDGEATLVQMGPTRMTPSERFEFSADGVTHRGRAEGWATTSGESVAITAAVRRFAEQHPKGFRAARDEFSILLWPEEAERSMVLPRGCEKTHDVMLVFHRPGDAGAQTVAKAFTKPAAIVCSPKWYCESGALGEISPARGGASPELERIAEGAFAAMKSRRASLREYGDFDYGDFADESQTDGWINVEYDTPYALLTQFAWTGNRDCLGYGLDAALHQGDIDIAHFVPTDPNLVGSQSIHTTGHLGRESKWFYYRTDHIWTQGLVAAYWLTGDRRHLDNAVLVGDYLARTAPCPDDDGAERPYAWSLIGLMAVCEATLGLTETDFIAKAREGEDAKEGEGDRGQGTGDSQMPPRCFGIPTGSGLADSCVPEIPKHRHHSPSRFRSFAFSRFVWDPAEKNRAYLDAARSVAEAVLAKAHPERGLWLREWGADSDGKPILGSSPFMSGLLLEGMIAYNAFAQDPRVDDFVVTSARAMIREAWVADNEGFYYHPASGGRGRPADPRQLLGLLRAYELTGDESILNVGLANYSACIRAHLASLAGEPTKGGADRNAKNYAIVMRTLPRVAAILSRPRKASSADPEPDNR